MHFVALFVFGAAIALIHMAVGGAVPAYSLPAFSLVGVATLFGSLAQIGRKPKPETWCVAAVVLLCLYLCVRGFLSPVEYLARADRAMVLGALGSYLLAAVVFTAPLSRILFFWTLALLGFAGCVIGAIQFVTCNNLMLFGFSRSLDYVRRASGFFICPNHFAGFLECALLGMLSFAVLGRGGAIRRICCIWLVLVLFAGLLITGSRGGYLSILVGLGVFVVALLGAYLRAVPRRFPLMLCISIAAVAILVGGGVWLMGQHDALKPRMDALIDYKNMRVDMWSAALSQFQTSPLFGTGAGTYLYFGRLFRPEWSYQTDPVHAHGDYVELLGEYGTLGAALLLFVLALHCIHGLRGIWGAQSERLSEDSLTSDSLASSVAALSIIGAQIAHAVVDFNMHIPANVLVVAFLLGILANPGLAIRQKKDGGTWFRRLLLGATALCIGFDCVPRIPSEWHAELARVALAKEDWLKATEEAKKGLSWDESNPELHAYLGDARLYRAATVPPGAVRGNLLFGSVVSLQRSVELFPQDVWKWISLGQAFDALGEVDPARAAFQRAIQCDPLLGIAHYYLGWHWEQARCYGDAAVSYQRSLALQFSKEAEEGRNRVLTRVGQTEESHETKFREK